MPLHALFLRMDKVPILYFLQRQPFRKFYGGPKNSLLHPTYRYKYGYLYPYFSPTARYGKGLLTQQSYALKYLGVFIKKTR